MKLNIDVFSPESIEAAVKRLELAQTNLDASCQQMLEALGMAGYWYAEGIAEGFVNSGDLLNNLKENEAAMTVEQAFGEDGATSYVVRVTCDVVAETNAGPWRPYHDQRAWLGRHYARTAELGSKRRPAHHYLTGAADELKGELPTYLQAVQL